MTEISDVLKEVKTFLKNFVVLRSSVGATELPSLLKSTLPSQSQFYARHNSPEACIVFYSLNLLKSIHDCGSLTSERSTAAMGVMDTKLVEVLVEISVYATICPWTTVWPKFNNDSTMNSIAQWQPLSSSLTELSILRLMEMINLKDASLVSLRRPGIIATILAGTLQTFRASIQELSLFKRMISSLPPLLVLQSVNILISRRGPEWAMPILSGEMSNVLTCPGGLSAVTRFLLQPDSGGVVPLASFDKLAGLIAAVPSRYSATSYMEVIAPQILALIDDQSKSREMSKRAAAYMLRKLFSKHPEASILLNAFWQPLLREHIDAENEEVQQSISRLSEMTAFEHLTEALLSKHVTTIVTLTYSIENDTQHTYRDLLYRLFYRLIEKEPELDLITSLDRLLPEHTVPVAKSPSLMPRGTENRSLHRKDPVVHFIKLLDIAKSNTTLLNRFFGSLLDRYVRTSDTQRAVQYLKLLHSIPERFPKAFTTMPYLRVWLDSAGTHFSKMLKKNGNLSMDDVTVIHLNILRLQVDHLDGIDLQDLTVLEILASRLMEFAQRVTSDDLRETMREIALKFELSIIKLKTTTRPAKTQETGDASAKLLSAAMSDLQDELVPSRAHGLYLLGQLAQSGTDEKFMQLPRLTPIILELLKEEEPFVYQNAIKTLKKLVDTYGTSIRLTLDEAQLNAFYSPQVRARISSVLENDAPP